MTSHTGGQLMAREMAEQPEALARLIGRKAEIGAIVRSVVPRDHRGTIFVARGSSDHACTVGRYLIELATSRPTSSASPSLYTHYDARTDFTGYLVIAVSQSGETPEISQVVSTARRHGARTLAITNGGGSQLANAADGVIELGVGEELATPATKTVTAELMALALVARALGDTAVNDATLASLPEQVATIVADDSAVRPAVDLFRDAAGGLVVARGLLLGAAAETALKLQETTGKLVLAMSSADLRHGPIAVAGKALPTLALVAEDPAYADMISIIQRLRAVGAPVVVAGAGPEADVTWQTGIPATLAPIVAVVRGQQIALRTATDLNVDPDRPDGLTKVTLT